LVGHILIRSKLIEAEDAVQKALKFHKATNSFLGQGNDYNLLGEVYLQLKKLEDATAACQKALEFHKLANRYPRPRK
jgi:tetratricopeptide (TPR) repeat protein